MMKELQEYFKNIYNDTDSNEDIETWIEFAFALVSEPEARNARASLRTLRDFSGRMKPLAELSLLKAYLSVKPTPIN